jgi:hypothetical protein
VLALRPARDAVLRWLRAQFLDVVLVVSAGGISPDTTARHVRAAGHMQGMAGGYSEPYLPATDAG